MSTTDQIYREAIAAGHSEEVAREIAKRAGKPELAEAKEIASLCRLVKQPQAAAHFIRNKTPLEEARRVLRNHMANSGGDLAINLLAKETYK